MRSLKLTTLLVILCAISVAVLALQGTSPLRRRGWKIGARVADTSALHRIYIAVRPKSNALDACDSELMAVSLPSSPRYGKHLTFEQVGKLTTDPQHFAGVMSYIRGVSGANWNVVPTLNQDFVAIDAPIADIERLFNARFHDFHAELYVATIARSAVGYATPHELAAHIDYIGNIDTFPIATKPRNRSAISAIATRQASGSVTPTLLNQYYGITNNTATNSATSQSVMEGLGQSYNPADLTQFQVMFNLPQQAVDKVVGPNNASACSDPNNCGEAQLDIEYIMAVAQGTKNTFWSIPQDQDLFVAWIFSVAADPNPPLVHSLSYGSVAVEDPSVDTTRFNLEACKLGTRGVTIVVSSGDDGVNSFEARNNASACGFSPSFPATCPYVTAVGATMGPESNNPEVACTSNNGGDITTGGGFSYWYKRPSWQTNQVNQYLKNGPNMPPLQLFNSTGRGYPDVSILGHAYTVQLAGQTFSESGTSASAPVFAGMLSLINDARLNAGNSPLGFVTPALYNAPTSVWNDITVGTNNCCASSVCCKWGFTAAPGWDPLTGLGSPHFPLLMQALTASRK